MTREFYAYPRRGRHQRFRRELFSDEQWAEQAWMYQDDAHTRSSDMFLLVQRDAALRNYDLSMSYFASLDPDEFESALTDISVAGGTFRQVHSLPDWDGVPGAYLMVFDQYRQFYIGQSSNIRARIVQHWSGSKSFDRLIFGGTYESIFPVDEFRALDTTRIYASSAPHQYDVEQRAERAANPRFCLNRMAGGEPTHVALMLSAVSPRTREHAVVAVPSTPAEYEMAKYEVSHVITTARGNGRGGLVEALSSLDMTIYLTPYDGGDSHLWSRRDLIAWAAARGELSVSEFASFLESMGEHIVWPAR